MTLPYPIPMTEEEFNRQYAEATRRGEHRLKFQPLAVAVKWSQTKGLILDLNNGVRLFVPLSFLPEFQHATPKQLAQVRVIPPGTAVEFTALDEHLGVLELLTDLLGEKLSPLLAQELGRRGGQSTSTANATAARVNGAKGGRPRKKPAAKS